MSTILSRRNALTILSGGAAALVVSGCRRAGVGADNAPPLLARMPPRDLAARLDEARDGKLDILHVGPVYLFGKARIPHARHVGEASTDDGYAAIVAELRKISAEHQAILYCGCCPIASCPNIAPAERAAREVGQLRAFVLDLPTTLKADWTDHGYPVEQG